MKQFGYFFVFLLGIASFSMGEQTFRPLTFSPSNRLSNASFLTLCTGGQRCCSWAQYGSGYTPWAEGHTDSASIYLVKTNAESCGASTGIALNQTDPRTIKVSGWNKAQNMSGIRDGNYSFYFDIVYSNGMTDAFVMPFDCGTHDWQYQEWYFQPQYPIKTLVPYAMLRGDHLGTAWFDDLAVQELASGESVQLFDAFPVSAIPETGVLLPDPMLTFSNDFQEWKFDNTGRPVEIWNAGQSWLSDSPHWSGFLVRDWRSPAATYSFLGTSTWVQANELQQSSSCETDLSLQVHYTFSNRYVEISGAVSNTATTGRFLTVFFALPQSTNQMDWCALDSNIVVESGTFNDYEPIGSMGGDPGQYSRLPLAVIKGPSRGMGFYVPPRHHRFHRMALQADMKAFFIAFDFYLAPMGSLAHTTADFTFQVLFTGTNTPFREALADIYSRDEVYSCPPEESSGGAWVAFSEVADIPESFHLAFHELARDDLIRSDDVQGLESFRYKAWPPTLEWQMADGSLDWSNYTEVLAYLSNVWVSGSTQEQENAEQIFSSGIKDANDHLVFFPRQSPWLPEPYGATFLMNSSPTLTNGTFPLTKAKYHWNTNAAAAYSTTFINEWGTLDGEFVDNLELYGNRADYDPAHVQATSFPPLFCRQELLPCIPLICSAQEFSAWLRDPVKAAGKKMTANRINIKYFFTAMNYDVLIDEWLTDEVETSLSELYEKWMFKRMAAGRKPVCILYNNYGGVTAIQKDSLFRICAYFAFYPSFYYDFSLAEEYWSHQEHWEGDEGLFEQFIPFVSCLHKAGWQPITAAHASHPLIRTIRYGNAPDIYLGIYNLSTQSVETSIGLDTAKMGFSYAEDIYLSWPLSNTYTIVSTDSLAFTQMLKRVEFVRLSGGIPAVGLKNGAHSIDTVETNLTLSITNNLFAFGHMSASNLATGAQFIRPVSSTSCTGSIALAWGTNAIALVCSNQTGTVVTQMVEIVMNDQDGDRIPDWWEISHFNFLDIADSTSDWDGDRICDRNEYLAGTDPTNPASYLALYALNPTNPAGIIVHWMSVTDKTYTLMMSTNILYSDSFSPILSNIPGRRGYTSATDTFGKVSGHFFYRIKLE